MPEIVPDSTIVSPPVTKSEVKNATDLPLGIKLTGGEKLRAEGKTGQGVRVAVIDSGVDKDHPELNGRVVKQVWYRGGTPLDSRNGDHGTHVAGTIHMMAPDAEIYDYRVFGDVGQIGVERAVSAAIFQAWRDGCNVINMSLGGRLPSFGIRAAIEFVHRRGIIVVVAAGNDGDGNILTNEER